MYVYPVLPLNFALPENDDLSESKDKEFTDVLANDTFEDLSSKVRNPLKL